MRKADPTPGRASGGQRAERQSVSHASQSGSQSGRQPGAQSMAPVSGVWCPHPSGVAGQVPPWPAVVLMAAVPARPGESRRPWLSDTFLGMRAGGLRPGARGRTSPARRLCRGAGPRRAGFSGRSAARPPSVARRRSMRTTTISLPPASTRGPARCACSALGRFRVSPPRRPWLLRRPWSRSSASHPPRPQARRPPAAPAAPVPPALPAAWAAPAARALCTARADATRCTPTSPTAAPPTPCART